MTLSMAYVTFIKFTGPAIDPQDIINMLRILGINENLYKKIKLKTHFFPDFSPPVVHLSCLFLLVVCANVKIYEFACEHNAM